MSTPRSWFVNWKDVAPDEQLAWFQASRRSGSAPAHGQEVVAAEDYDALARLLEDALERERKIKDALLGGSLRAEDVPS